LYIECTVVVHCNVQQLYIAIVHSNVHYNVHDCWYIECTFDAHLTLTPGWKTTKVHLSAYGPLCEACLCFPTHCWNWYSRHEFYNTCYFFGMHVRRIRLIPKIIRVNFIDTVFFTVTCFVLEVCLFWHVLPFFSGHCVFFCMGYLFLLPFWHVLPFALFFWCPAACISL
jgi:hypothetical protein